jgi:acyl-CoA reductase-like NAD-dependent aldehyde dehydrogenase
MAKHTIDNPFTGETAVTIDQASEAEIGKVLDAAQESAKVLRKKSVEERIAICEQALAKMEANAETIAQDITKQMGKPLSQSRGEVKGMAGRWRHMTSIAKEALADIVLPAKDGFDRRIAKEPLGVVLDLPAWNYPLLTAVNAVVPAVLAGNAVVLKHSPRTPLCGAHFADAFGNEWVRTFFSDYATTEKIVGDPRVNGVLFTGSVLGGHKIQAAAKDRFIPVGLELGGNDPAYVAADADLQNTVENVVDGAIYNAGQSCCAVDASTCTRRSTTSSSTPASRSFVRTSPAIRRTTRRPSVPSRSHGIRRSSTSSSPTRFGPTRRSSSEARARVASSPRR